MGTEETKKPGRPKGPNPRELESLDTPVWSNKIWRELWPKRRRKVTARATSKSLVLGGRIFLQSSKKNSTPTRTSSMLLESRRGQLRMAPSMEKRLDLFHCARFQDNFLHCL